MKDQKKGFTLVELIIASGVFLLIGTVVFSLYHFSYKSFSITTWKQDAQNHLKLNNAFWQKYLSGATHKLAKLSTDAQGTIIGDADITVIPFKIKNRGSGDLLALYSGAGPYSLWSGEVHVKDEGSVSYQTFVVEGYLLGKHPDVELYGKVLNTDGSVVRSVLLLKNVAKIEASIRPYPEEYSNSLRLVFTVQDPKRPDITADGVIEVRINTEIEEL